MSDSGRHRSPVSPGDVVGGKYRVEKVLGAGGMGVVVAATHIELAQPVALKFILPTALTGSGALERFMREARAAVRLRSEHVCRVLDVGRDREDRPYMVLELLEGMDLAKLAKHQGSLPVADAVEYVLQACDALVEAHALGIVHRDLKPQNIFVTRRLNGTPLVKVLDFGIAKSVGPAAVGQMALTDSAAIIGSPLYMAPEQMRSPKTVDVRIDIWALGVILYELLGGQLPFDGDTVTEVCIKVVNEEPTRLLDLRPALDRKLVDVVMRCLEKDVEDRWQNVAQLAMELEPFSRSGRHGSLVRPWRSFEDTHDSQDGGARARAIAAAVTPDDTGPSTAITMPSMPPDVLAANAAARGLPQTPVPVSVKVTGATGPAVVRASTPVPGSAPAPLAAASDPRAHLTSTDTAWGEGTARRTAQPKTFATGLLAGLAASVAAAAVAAAILLRSSGPPPAVASEAPPPAASTVVPAPEASATPAVGVAATSPSSSSGGDVVPVKETPPAPVPTPVRQGSGRPSRAPGRVTPVAAAAAAPNTSTAPAAAPPPPSPASPPRAPEAVPSPKPAESLAPNGAPILR